MAEHNTQGGKAFRVIKDRIERYALFEPVTAVLVLTFRVDIDPACTNDEKKGIRDRLRTLLRDDFLAALTRGIEMTFGRYHSHVTMSFEETSPGAVHFTTQDPRLDEIKAKYLKMIVRAVNEVWQTNIQAHKLFDETHVTAASVSFLLSKPLEYFEQEVEAGEDTIENTGMVD
jgi:hypothetical protein